MAETVQEAVYITLHNDATITGIFGNRIDYLYTPDLDPSTPVPYLNFWTAASVERHETLCDDKGGRTRLTFSICHDDHIVGARYRRIAIDAVKSIRGVNEAIQFTRSEITAETDRAEEKNGRFLFEFDAVIHWSK